ncbi:MAG: NAD-dependent deacetylase [Treponema sp.]|jgi:NAD-dependent deacetylase|nr:NAD-dependent deacetylase [Treponema sp.]
MSGEYADNYTIEEKLRALFDKITSARHCVAFTGAGVSALSGIRDFRGKNGLYTSQDTAEDAQKMFDIDYFEQDASYYYKAAAGFIYNLDEKEPSIVHTTLAELERRGLLKAVITQNIDLLHQKAGGKRVIEAHGSPTVHYCLRCAGVRMSFEEAAAIVKSGGTPRCPHCDRPLKPAITFFGEALPIDALRQAQDEAQTADLMLTLGSSLTVNPAASLPRVTLAHGGDIVIVNDRETYLDRRACLLFDDLETVFRGLRAFLTAGA